MSHNNNNSSKGVIMSHNSSSKGVIMSHSSSEEAIAAVKRLLTE